MAIIGYARGTTAGSVGNQVQRLSEYGCDPVFTNDNWTDCLAHLQPGDTLVAVRLDRIGRSARDLLHILQDVEDGGARLVLLDQGIDTATPTGKLAFAVLAEAEDRAT